MAPLSIMQSFLVAAKCVAQVALLDAGALSARCNKWLAMANGSASDDCVQRIFAFLLLGEVGQRRDLSRLNMITEAFLDVFAGDDDDLKMAAATALGKLTLGNLDVFLPFLLQKIHDDSRIQYLMLQALKEVRVNERVITFKRL